MWRRRGSAKMWCLSLETACLGPPFMMKAWPGARSHESHYAVVTCAPSIFDPSRAMRI